MDTLTIEGVDIAYKRAGTGTSLLLLHGAIEDSRAWHRQLDDFAEHYDVVAWDAPGCGRSGDPPESIGMDGFARCAIGLVEALGLDRPHLLGLSWGSGLALEIYRLRPDLPRSLVLTGAYAGWAGSLPPDEVQRRLTQVIAESDLPAEEWAPGWIPGLLTDRAPDELRAQVLAEMSDFHPAGVRAMARAFADLDLQDVLPTIDVPTLLLYGELDARSPVSVGEALQRQIPGSRLQVLPATGHLSNQETPHAFNEAVLAFLATVDT